MLSTVIVLRQIPAVNAQTTHEGAWKTDSFADLNVEDAYVANDSQRVEWWYVKLTKNSEYSVVDILGYNPQNELFLSYTFRDDDTHGYFTMPVGWRYVETVYVSTDYMIAITLPQPSPQTIQRSGTARYSVVVKTISGSPQPVTLTVVNPPPDSIVTWESSNIVTPDASETLVSFTITTFNTPFNTYTFFVSGTSNEITVQSAPATLTVASTEDFPYVLQVHSSPINGVPISMSEDYSGDFGVTDFVMKRSSPFEVTLTASSTVGAFRFSSWQLDGMNMGGRTSLSVVINDTYKTRLAIAIYTSVSTEPSLRIVNAIAPTTVLSNERFYATVMIQYSFPQPTDVQIILSDEYSESSYSQTISLSFQSDGFKTITFEVTAGQYVERMGFRVEARYYSQGSWKKDPIRSETFLVVNIVRGDTYRSKSPLLLNTSLSFIIDLNGLQYKAFLTRNLTAKLPLTRHEDTSYYDWYRQAYSRNGWCILDPSGRTVTEMGVCAKWRSQLRWRTLE